MHNYMYTKQQAYKTMTIMRELHELFYAGGK